MDNPSNEQNEQSDKMPKFFLEKKGKPEKKKSYKKLFGLKKKSAKTDLVKKDETSLVDADFNRNKLFSKGINLMADEKLEDASHVFQMILRINPNDVDALLKLGYSRFHLEDYTESMRAYDKYWILTLQMLMHGILRVWFTMTARFTERRLILQIKQLILIQHLEWRGIIGHAIFPC